MLRGDLAGAAPAASTGGGAAGRLMSEELLAPLHASKRQRTRRRAQVRHKMPLCDTCTADMKDMWWATASCIAEAAHATLQRKPYTPHAHAVSC